MQVDLFYELSVPPGQRQQAVFHHTLDSLGLAERLGFNGVWLAEHHAMPGYSHSSAPDLLLASICRQTQALRLGLAIVPLPQHHPLHVAERLATLDLLSDGRLEFGIGRGFHPREFSWHGQDPAHSRARMLEALQVILAAWRGPIDSFEGRFYQIKDYRLLPAPTTLPPLWMACVSPESFRLAAEYGLGSLAGPFKPRWLLQRDLKQLRRQQSQPWRNPLVLAQRNTQAAMTIGIYCDRDQARARQRAEAGFVWFYEQLLAQVRPVLTRMIQGYEDYRRLGRLLPVIQGRLSLRTLEWLGLVIVGDAEHCRRQLIKLKHQGFDRVLLANGAGVLPAAQQDESLQRLAQEVMPHLQAPSSATPSEEQPVCP